MMFIESKIVDVLQNLNNNNNSNNNFKIGQINKCAIKLWKNVTDELLEHGLSATLGFF